MVEYRHVMTKSEKDTYEILKEQLVGGTSSSEGQIARMQIADIESRPDDNLAQIKSVLEKRVCFSKKVMLHRRTVQIPKDNTYGIHFEQFLFSFWIFSFLFFAFSAGSSVAPRKFRFCFI